MIRAIATAQSPIVITSQSAEFMLLLPMAGGLDDRHDEGDEGRGDDCGDEDDGQAADRHDPPPAIMIWMFAALAIWFAPGGLG
jgi:hypothetical protein